MDDPLEIFILANLVINYSDSSQGRIVNRFSGDVETMDSTLPLTLRTVVQSGGWVLESLINVGYSTPVVLTVIVPVIAAYMFMQVSQNNC